MKSLSTDDWQWLVKGRYGQALTTARENAGLTQEQLSKEASKQGNYKISRTKIAMIETGQRLPTTEDLFHLGKVLHVSPGYLLTGNSDENRQDSPSALGLSDEALTAIRNLDPDQLAALDSLITDPIFLSTFAGYLSGKDEIWKNGKRIATANDDVTLGGLGDFGTTYRISDLVRIERERMLTASLLDIFRRIRKGKENHEESQR